MRWSRAISGRYGSRCSPSSSPLATSVWRGTALSVAPCLVTLLPRCGWLANIANSRHPIASRAFVFGPTTCDEPLIFPFSLSQAENRGFAFCQPRCAATANADLLGRKGRILRHRNRHLVCCVGALASTQNNPCEPRYGAVKTARLSVNGGSE